MAITPTQLQLHLRVIAIQKRQLELQLLNVVVLGSWSRGASRPLEDGLGLDLGLEICDVAARLEISGVAS